MHLFFLYQVSWMGGKPIVGETIDCHTYNNEHFKMGLQTCAFCNQPRVTPQTASTRSLIKSVVCFMPLDQHRAATIRLVNFSRIRQSQSSF